MTLHDETRSLVCRPSVLGIIPRFSDRMETGIVLCAFLGPLGVIGPNEQLAIVVQFAHKLSPSGVFIERDTQMVGAHIRGFKAQLGVLGVPDDAPGRYHYMLPLAVNPLSGEVIKFAAIIVL